MNNEPVAWMSKIDNHIVTFDKRLVNEAEHAGADNWMPMYLHPVKEQLSNGHLSDCAIHNEPASRNKPCDCGFEPKFNLSDLKHEDNCRYFDDGEFCTCGAEDSALVDWYRHKEETHPVKELTDEEIKQIYKETHFSETIGDCDYMEFARAILRKAQESCNGFCGEYECKENKAGCKRKAQEK